MDNTLNLIFENKELTRKFIEEVLSYKEYEYYNVSKINDEVFKLVICSKDEEVDGLFEAVYKIYNNDIYDYNEYINDFIINDYARFKRRYIEEPTLIYNFLKKNKNKINETLLDDEIFKYIKFGYRVI